MRKLLLAAAIGAIAVPAYAADMTGLGSGMIIMHFVGTVLPGKEATFKEVVAKVVAAAHEEPGTLMYEWNFRPDNKTFDVLEMYKSSAAVVAHINDVLPKFGKQLGGLQKEDHFMVFGSPDEAAKKSLAPLNPIFTSHIVGFIRLPGAE